MASARKVRGRWYARFKGAEGRWQERALPRDTSGKARALQLAHGLEGREWRVKEGLEAPPAVETLAAAAARYLQAIRHHRSWPSIESRWRLHVLPALGQIPIGKLRPTQVEELLAHLKDEGYSQQTRRHVRTTLSALYSWLKRDRAVSTNPLEEVEAIPVPAGAPKALSEAEVLRVAEAASFPGLRHLVLLAFYTAARPGEILAATWGDVDSGAAQLHIRRTTGSATTKTGKARVAFLPAPALALLEEMRSRPGAALFLNADGQPMKLRQAARAFSSAVRRAGLVRGWEAVCRRKGCGWREERSAAEGGRCPRCAFVLYVRPLAARVSLKDLRSSSITQIVERTGSLHAASAQAGHASEATTRRHYLAMRAPHIADAVRRAFGAPAPPAALALTTRPGSLGRSRADAGCSRPPHLRQVLLT